MQSLGMINASLKNHTVLITGGGSGIGFSTAELFAKMNANVVINYLSDDKDSKKRVFDFTLLDSEFKKSDFLYFKLFC